MIKQYRGECSERRLFRLLADFSASLQDALYLDGFIQTSFKKAPGFLVVFGFVLDKAELSHLVDAPDGQPTTVPTELEQGMTS